MRRYATLLVGITLLSGLSSVVKAAPACPFQNVTIPTFDRANFANSTKIDNTYFPLIPGTTFVYDGVDRGKPEHDEVTVTHDTKLILGVNSVVVRDTVSVHGVVEEDTIDWYAQDKLGNVWYMGEFSSQFDKDGVLTGHEGSWEAGVDGALPGFIMEAHAQVSDTYQQEFLAGVAEDTAQILSLTESVTVPYGSWQGNVLVTAECTPLARTVLEQKFYAPGVGEVLEEGVKGGSARSELVAIRTE